MLDTQNKQGFTLLELMTSLMVIGIVFGLCTVQLGPSLQRQLDYYSLKRIHHFIYFARSAAIASGRLLSLCTGNELGCQSGKDQWLIWRDDNADGQYNDDEHIVRLMNADEITARFNRSHFRFKADGSIWPNGSITLCAKSDYGPGAKVTFLYTGKIDWYEEYLASSLCRKN